MKTTLLFLLFTFIAGSVMAQKKHLDTAAHILNNKLKLKIDSDLWKSPALNHVFITPNLSRPDQPKGNMLASRFRLEDNANSGFNMPIAKLKGNSKIPIAKLGGNSKMAVVADNSNALKEITKANP